MIRRRVSWIVAGAVGLVFLFGLQQVLYPLAQGPTYRFVRAFGQEELSRPVGIALSEGRVYVTDTDNDRMAVFSPQGDLLGTGGSQGSAPGQFRRPMHMNTGPEGNLFVADMLNHRVQKFSPGGKLLRVYGSKGTGRGEFRQPSGVAVDSEGNLYVTEFMNQRVQKLSPEGDFLHQWGHTGVKGYFRYSYFNYPTDVAAAAGGSWLGTDAYNERIKP